MTISDERKKHWLRQDLWTVDEASFLLAGVEPGSEPPPPKRVKRLKQGASLKVRLNAMTKANSEFLAFKTSLTDSREAISRAVKSRALQLVEGKWIEPAELIKWAVLKQLPNCPFKLDSLANWPTAYHTLGQKKRTEKADWILATLRDMLLEPSRLSKTKTGMPGWRDAVKKKLPPLDHAPNMSENQFKKLWQELRKSGEIGDE